MLMKNRIKKKRFSFERKNVIIRPSGFDYYFRYNNILNHLFILHWFKPKESSLIILKFKGKEIVSRKIPNGCYSDGQEL